MDYKIQFKYIGNNLFFKQKIDYDRWNNNQIDKTTTTRYSYNKHNKVIVEIEGWESLSYSDLKKIEYIYKYDTTLVEKNVYRENGNLGYKLKYSKDNNGNIIETKYHSSGDQMNKTVYNNEGFIINGYLEEGYNPIYNSAFNKIKVSYSNNITVKTYLKNISHSGYKQNAFNTCIYNGDKNIIKEYIEYDSQEKYENKEYATVSREYIYIYDTNNNWVKKRIDSYIKDPDNIVDIYPIIIEERIIEYY